MQRLLIPQAADKLQDPKNSIAVADGNFPENTLEVHLVGTRSVQTESGSQSQQNTT